MARCGRCRPKAATRRVIDIEPGILTITTRRSARPAVMISHYTNNQFSIDIVEDGARQVLVGPFPHHSPRGLLAQRTLVFQRVEPIPAFGPCPSISVR